MNTTNKEEVLTRVQREDGKYNLINAQGKYLSEQWYDWIDYFYNEFARVRRDDNLYNFINKDGKIISDEWFRYVDYFDEYDFAKVKRTNGEQAKIDKTGKIVVSK